MKKLFLSILLSLGGLLLAASSAFAVETPTIMHANYMGNGKVYLHWNEVSDATYQIGYGPVGNPLQYGVALGTGTSYTVEQLFQNTSYVFYVRAIKNNGVSGYSNGVKLYVGDSGRMSESTNAEMTDESSKAAKMTAYDMSKDTMRTDAQLNDPSISSGKPGVGHLNLRTSSGPNKGQVTLHWNAAETIDAGNYNIIYTDDPTVWKWGVTDINPEARSFTVGYLQPGKRYWFKLSTTNTGFTPWVSDIAR